MHTAPADTWLAKLLFLLSHTGYSVHLTLNVKLFGADMDAMYRPILNMANGRKNHKFNYTVQDRQTGTKKSK